MCGVCSLDSNDIGDEGAIAISAALESNTTLEDLSLKSYDGGTQITAAGAQAIAKMLVVNRALKSANFSYNSFGDEGTAALSEALKSNSTLEELKLDANRIGAAGAQSLAGMLQVNRSLNSVDLRGNTIPDEGEQQLRDAVGDKNVALKF